MSCSKRLNALRALRLSSSRVIGCIPNLYGEFAHRPGKQVENALSNLQRAGFEGYYRVLNELRESVFVVQVYIPGMERFNLIRSGKWVAPHRALLVSDRGD